jgi:ABC-type multidrug transport system fused ATPase/permease subunit
MITLLSTIVSFLAGGLPKILDFFQDRGDKAHELEIMRLQIERETEMAKLGFQVQERIAEIQAEQAYVDAQVTEKKALYAHDVEIGRGASQWVVNLRASVRPVITYAMFGMLAFINVWGAWYAWDQGVPFSEALSILWTEDTQILFASVISFWFGSQAFGRR